MQRNFTMAFYGLSTETSQEKGKIMNFCKRSYQPILRYLYTETIKRGGKISLH